MEIWACSTMDDSFLNWCITKNRYLYPKLSRFYFFSQFNIAILSPMCASSGSESSIFILRGGGWSCWSQGNFEASVDFNGEAVFEAQRFWSKTGLVPTRSSQAGLRNIWHGFWPLGDTLCELGRPAGKKKVPTLESIKYLKHTWMIWDFNRKFLR